MARALAENVADIIALARARLTQVEVDEDISIDRTILVIEGYFKKQPLNRKISLARGVM